jgi:antitoxin MazE
MKTHVQRWGNSLAVRIPKTLAIEVGLQPSAEIEITIQNGQIVLTPLTRRTYSLENLVERITDENRHSETDFGADIGNEIVK